MTRKPALSLLALATGALLISGCGTFFRQIGGAKAFADCEFRIKEVKEVTLGGTPATDLMKVSALPAMWNQFGQEQLMLAFKLIIEVRNPNPVQARMNKVDWILILDDLEMVRGVITEKVELPPGPISISDLPMQIELDVKKVFSKEGAKSWMKLAASLAGVGDHKTNIRARVKPTLEIAGVDYELADYVDVYTEFTSERGRELRSRKGTATPAPDSSAETPATP